MEGRKNAPKVFSAIVADDTEVIRLVIFGLVNCQKAKSIIQENSVVAAKWNKATYDLQELHCRPYELEKWQFRLDESTVLQTPKSSSFKTAIPNFEKAKEERNEIISLE